MCGVHLILWRATQLPSPYVRYEYLDLDDDRDDDDASLVRAGVNDRAEVRGQDRRRRGVLTMKIIRDLHRLLRLLAIVVVLAPGLASAADYVVIVNPGNRASSVSRNELQRLFLRTATTWSGGEGCKPVDLPKSNPVRVAFSKEVLGRTMAALDQFWTQSIFSGRGVPPPERKSDREVVEFVRDTPGAVGYVSSAVGLEGVKKLTVND
jgi:hypothetical protein